LTKQESAAMVSVARAVIIGMAVIVVTVFLIFTRYGLLKDPLSFFFMAYSVQFALLAPMAMTKVSLRARPTAGAVILSILLGLVTSLVVGFGSWFAVIHNGPPFLNIAPGDWLTLTPVITLCIGLMPLLVSSTRSAFGQRRPHAHH